jgi:cell division protein YceG involved in septum cleavage
MKKLLLFVALPLYLGYYLRFGQKGWLAKDLVKLQDEAEAKMDTEIIVPGGLGVDPSGKDLYIAALVKENSIFQLRTKYNSYLKDLGKSIFLP